MKGVLPIDITNSLLTNTSIYVCLLARVCVGGRRGVFNEELWCVAGWQAY